MTAWIITPEAAAQSPRWRMQYFYDQNKTELSLHDIQTPSAKRGFAIGTIQDERGGSRKPVAVVTSDGGAHWVTKPLPALKNSEKTDQNLFHVFADAVRTAIVPDIVEVACVEWLPISTAINKLRSSPAWYNYGYEEALLRKFLD